MEQRRKEWTTPRCMKDVRSLSKDSFVYLSGAICGDCNSDTEIRRITAGANAWRKVEGVMGDRQISQSCSQTAGTDSISPNLWYPCFELHQVSRLLQRLVQMPVRSVYYYWLMSMECNVVYSNMITSVFINCSGDIIVSLTTYIDEYVM